MPNITKYAKWIIGEYCLITKSEFMSYVDQAACLVVTHNRTVLRWQSRRYSFINKFEAFQCTNTHTHTSIHFARSEPVNVKFQMKLTSFFKIILSICTHIASSHQIWMPSLQLQTIIRIWSIFCLHFIHYVFSLLPHCYDVIISIVRLHCSHTKFYHP